MSNHANLRRNTLLAVLAIALTGCGRTASPMVTVPPAPRNVDVVGLPANYHAGEAVPGGDNTPSLRAVDWPRMTHTEKGDASDPINLVIGGSERQVRAIFAAAGWVQADKTNVITAAKMIKAVLTDSRYPTAPMSDLYLYNRVEDMALQKNGTSARNRDHLRVWKTPLLDHAGQPFWAVAATKDIAVKLAPGELMPTHEISPDIDAERSLVATDFVHSGQVVMQYQLQSLQPNFHSKNGGGDEIYSDGRVQILELRPTR